MDDLQKELFKLRDEEYAKFQCKLVPGITGESVIGIRVPVLRKFAKEYKKSPDAHLFLTLLPHKYYDENMLHALLISEMKDYDEIIYNLDKFLPYVDNWAVCDIMSPKALKKNKDKLIFKIDEWIKSEHTYTCRFGMEMLMTFYLDEDFKEEYLKMPASVHSDEYYVNMMIAWYFATALAKQQDTVLKYIEDYKLDKWVHNKTIQKAIESYRVSPECKRYLKTLKR